MSRKQKPKSSLNNQLRIIGGQWRGRKLLFPNSEGLRPTSDRVRETLFNWLAPVIHNAHCLDLFSGSGALGLEALSRGASSALLIDANSKVSDQLKNNLNILNCSSGKVLTKDAISWLKTAICSEKPFDIIFIDPPFNKDLVKSCCELLDTHGFAGEGSYIYIETESNLPLEIPQSWQIHREKRAGQVSYYLCIKQG